MHVLTSGGARRYFLAVFLQLQFFEGLCEAKYGAPLPMPLHECDLYGSREAGSCEHRRSWDFSRRVHRDRGPVVRGTRGPRTFIRWLLIWDPSRTREPLRLVVFIGGS